MNSKTRQRRSRARQAFKVQMEEARLRREIEGPFEPTPISAPWLIDPTIGKPVFGDNRNLYAKVEANQPEKLSAKEEFKVRAGLKNWKEKAGPNEPEKIIREKPAGSLLHPDTPGKVDKRTMAELREAWAKEDADKAASIAMKEVFDRLDKEHVSLVAKGLFVPRPIYFGGAKETPAKAPKAKPEVEPVLVKEDKPSRTVVFSRDHANMDPVAPRGRDPREKQFAVDANGVQIKGKYSGKNRSVLEKAMAQLSSPRRPLAV